MAVPYVSEQDFEREVLRSELPVLIDFTATWCGPCKTVAPEVEAVARELEGKAKVVKIDIDKSKRIAASLRIQAVPTFIAFHRGRPVAAEQGVVKRAQLRAMMEPFLPRAEGAVRSPELAQLIQEGQGIPVDTREAAAYARARIPTAVHIPLKRSRAASPSLHMMAAPLSSTAAPATRRKSPRREARRRRGGPRRLPRRRLPRLGSEFSPSSARTEAPSASNARTESSSPPPVRPSLAGEMPAAAAHALQPEKMGSRSR
ncbi:MAG: thioredoxin [Polyangiaceae bacterium]